MKYFNEDYKTNLYKTIEDIENNSLVEIVVIVKERSADYKDILLWFAFAFMVFAYTLFMFTPLEFDPFLIYFFTILSFFIGFGIIFFIPALKRLFIKKKRQKKAVEIFGRAIFQKGGIRFTDEKIGVLIYASVFEKEVIVIADRGAEVAIPEEEWQTIKKGFDNVFYQSNPAEKLLENLQACKSIFSQYIPPIENDINELPDDLEVDL